MSVKEIIKILDAKAVTMCNNIEALNIVQGCASDLMSDVLTLDKDNVLLVTGLCNIQTIRTAEMANVPIVCFARNKKVTEDMLLLAQEIDMTLLECKYSMFKVVSILAKYGIIPVY